MANRSKGSHGWSSWRLKGGDEGIREEGIGTFGAALFDFVLERGFKKTPWASAVPLAGYYVPFDRAPLDSRVFVIDK